MAGYDGLSMSWNAISAYEDGAMPLSKWTKEAFAYWLDVTLREEQGIETKEARDQIINDLMQKYPMWFLKNQFLVYHSWHHTSKTFNETSFFCLSEIKVDMHLSGHCDLAKAFEQAKIDRLMEQKEKAQEKALRKALIVYEEWEGSSRHGKYVKHKKYCLVSGIWASFPSWGGVKEHSNNLTRKRIDGKHVLALQYFDRAPNGTGRYFKEIEKLVHKRKKHANGRRS